MCLDESPLVGAFDVHFVGDRPAQRGLDNVRSTKQSSDYEGRATGPGEGGPVSRLGGVTRKGSFPVSNDRVARGR